MPKAKKTSAKKSVKHTKKSSFREHREDGVYWYGIHVHHVGLGVAAVGTLVIVLLVQQTLPL